MLQERRRFARLYVGVEAAYCRSGEKVDNKPTVLVQDISIAGLRFLGKEIMPLGTRLDVDLMLPERSGALSLEATVVWQNQFSKSFYDTGISFAPMNAQTQRLLEQCLQHQLGRSEEQRRFVRCGLSTMVTYELLPSGAGSHTCLTMDVSLSGMRVLMRERLKTGARVRVSFALPDDTIHVAADGEVAWSQKGEHDLFETGIEFSEIADADLDRLNNYIKQSLKIDW